MLSLDTLKLLWVRDPKGTRDYILYYINNTITDTFRLSVPDWPQGAKRKINLYCVIFKKKLMFSDII